MQGLVKVIMSVRGSALSANRTATLHAAAVNGRQFLLYIYTTIAHACSLAFAHHSAAHVHLHILCVSAL